MPDTDAAKKLDLSKLTDEEAQHVWEVVQRDFNLRKKEEDRLGDLKTKIEREDTKTELLGNQTSLTETHCIRCLQPFKFLMNNKRQCLDCQLAICKSCSRYNKREDGWVCDACHMARVLKIGTLEWYHENVRSRFKRFGSAKVMRSLFRRFDGERSRSQSDFGEPQEYDTQSMSEGHNEAQSLDSSYSQQHKRMKKIKRRLTVDPIDLLDCNHGRGRSAQAPGSEDIMLVELGVRESAVNETESDAVFQNILEEQHQDVDLEMSSPQENRTIPSRSVSRLSYSSYGSVGGPRCSSSVCLPGLEDSDEEDGRCPPYLHYHTSQESLNSANPPPQITDLNKRMSAIENILNRLEQNVMSSYNQTPVTPSSSSPLPLWQEVDMEEQLLRQKLHQMTDNISDHSLTSDDDDGDEEQEGKSSQEIPVWRSPRGDFKPSRLPTRPTSRTSIVVSRLEEESHQHSDPEMPNQLLDSLERRGLPSEEGSKVSFRGSTALLVELEDKVAQAAADVQNAQSEVSDIESRIAALNAAGMPADKRRRSAIPVQARRLSPNFPTKTSNDPRVMKRRLTIM
ncbi:melanophilin-like isoform 2-T2 [Pholidichthys leucotaenia]